jgi:hypothetical protein
MTSPHQAVVLQWDTPHPTLYPKGHAKNELVPQQVAGNHSN